MQTYSHFLITAFIWYRLRRRVPPVDAGKAFLWGSVAPDIPLIILSIWFTVKSWVTDEEWNSDKYDDLYFHNWLWIVSTSLFHAPLLVLLYWIVGKLGSWLGRKWGDPIAWFSLACALHIVIDVFTHAGDGPLLLFPFHWVYRYKSPVSYYDPKYHGRIFAVCEHLLDMILLTYLVMVCVKHRREKRQGVTKTHESIDELEELGVNDEGNPL